VLLSRIRRQCILQGNDYCGVICLLVSPLAREPLGRKSSADYATHLCPQKLALTSPTSGGRSVGVVRLRSQVTEFVVVDDEAVSVHLYMFLTLSLLRHSL
jgi:hypothetical protein